MTSTDSTAADLTAAEATADACSEADIGLLSPGYAGTPVAAATGDAAFLQAMLDAEAALTRAQAAVGLAPAEAGQAVTRAARAGAFDLRSLAVRARSGGNPVIPLVADLTRAVPEPYAGFVHRGATSQDILDTAAMLVADRARRLILADLARTATTLAALAAAHRATPIPGRTLTQHAVPTTFGLKAAGWRALLLDAHDRLAAVVLPAQLGGAAGTLAAFGEQALPLAQHFAAETGLAPAPLPWHVLRTPVAELGAALALTGGALGKLAADVLVLSRTEIGELAEGSGGGSSAMPHKANPVRSVLIASAARRLPSLAAVLFAAMSAEDERPAGAWHSEWQPLREALRLVGGAAQDAAELTAGLHVAEQRMRAHLDLTRGLIVSERLLAALEPQLGRSEARAVLTRASRRAAAEAIGLDEALADEPTVTGVLDPEQLSTLLDPTGYTGAATALTDRALLRRPVAHQHSHPQDRNR